MKFGQSSFVYFNYSLKDAICGIGKAGYDSIEIWGGRPHYYRRDLDDELHDILALLDKYEMTVPNFIPAQFRYPSILCSLNENVRRDSVAYIKDTIDSAVKVNAGSVSICPGTSLHGENPDRAWNALKTSIMELADYCGNKPISILIEHAHKWETNLIFTVDDALRMIKETGSDKIGICLDTGHVHINGEDFSEAIKTACKYPLHIHIDDNNGESDEHMIPGKGTIDFRPLVSSLKDIDYQGCVSAELGFQYTLAPDDAVQETMQFFKNMFQA